MLDRRPEPHRVRRDRILREVVALDPPVLAIVAPGGWGKSFLLEDWASLHDGTVRIALDRRHEDAGLLLETVAIACARAAGEPSEAWLERVRPDGRAAGTRLRGLVARLPRPAALAIDDAHVLPPGPVADEILDALVDMARAGDVRLAVASRRMPGCIHPRDLVHGTALRLEPRALALDADEAARFLAGLPGAGDPVFLEQALCSTRGWPAGLRVLRHRLMRDTAAAAAAVQADVELADYFDTEILAPLPGSVRAALADLALLDGIEPDACHAIGAADALEYVASLAAEGLFVSRSDDVLHLHPMLREHLVARGRTADPDRVAERLTRLARWHLANGRTRAGLAVALDALASTGDETREATAHLAAECLEAAIPTLLQWARRDAILEAGATIPEDAIGARPYLSRLLAWARGSGEPPPAPADAPPAVRCMDQLLAATAALREERIDLVTESALRAREALPADDVFLRNLVVSVLQAAYRFGGDPRAGHAAIQEASLLAERLDSPADAVQAGAMLGILLIMHGRLHAAEAALRRALAIADERLDEAAPIRGLAHQFLGYVLYEWNRLDESADELQRARAVAEPVRHRGILTGVLRVLALVQLARGDRDAAAEAMDALARIVNRPEADQRNREWLDGARAAFAIAAGDSAALAGWIARQDYRAEQIAALPAPDLHRRMQEYATLARALIALGRCEEAGRLAAALESVARAANRTGFATAAAAAAAAAYEFLDRRGDADAALCRALETGAPESLIRTISDTPGPIAAILARARPNGVPLSFLEAVRRCAGDGAAPAGLTDRERDVLVLLAGGHSNKALARMLGISVSTVKTHLNHAFGKLGAHSRTHALARARELGLLPGPPLA